MMISGLRISLKSSPESSKPYSTEALQSFTGDRSTAQPPVATSATCCLGRSSGARLRAHLRLDSSPTATRVDGRTAARSQRTTRTVVLALPERIQTLEAISPYPSCVAAEHGRSTDSSAIGNNWTFLPYETNLP